MARKWSRRKIIVGSAAVVAGGVAAPFIFRNEFKQPNIIFILLDDMGYSDLSMLGGSAATPHLDRLGQSGMLFTQGYNSARCWPTRAAVMTGLYPHEAGNAFPFGADAPPAYQGTTRQKALMLPEVLQANGYATYHIGKWHLATVPGTEPLQRGFDHSYWVTEQDNLFNPTFIYDDETKFERPGINSGFYTTTAITEQCIRRMKGHSPSNRPFFMYIAHVAPHFPLHAPPDTIAKFANTFAHGWDEERKRRAEFLSNNSFVKGIISPRDPEIRPWASLTESERMKEISLMAIHAAMIDHVDYSIGKITAELSALGLLDNTLIMLLSDNGASSEVLVRGDGNDPSAPAGSAATYLTLGRGWAQAANSPFKQFKVSTFEGGIRTPVLAHWPNALYKAGSVSSQITHAIDLAPTALEAAKIEAFELDGRIQQTSGISLMNAFTGKEIVNRTVFVEHEGNCALRDGDWKVVRAFQQPWELYDLSVDPCETNNLAVSKPASLTALVAKWQTMADAQGVVPWESFSGQQYVPSDAYRR